MDFLFLNIGTKEMLFLSLIPLIFIIYSIYHIINNDKLHGNKKILWIVCIFVLNFMGCFFYWFLGNNTTKQ